MVTANQIADCIKMCLTSSVEAEAALAEYLAEIPNHKIKPAFVKILTDCAQLSAVTAEFMARESNLSIICAACTEICEQAARVCQLIESEKVRKHSEVIKISAACCRQISQLAVAA